LPFTRAFTGLTAQRPTLRLLARVVRENGRAYAPRYAVAFIFMFVFAGATALSAWMMRDVINQIFVDRNSAALAWIPVAVLAIFVVKGLASYLQEVTLARIGNASSARPRSACSTTCCAWILASTRRALPMT
jgi:ATP-binding cassette, subfamily B, bacterial MsbA